MNVTDRVQPPTIAELEADPIVRQLRSALEAASAPEAEPCPLHAWTMTVTLRRGDQRLLHAGSDNALTVSTLRENIREKSLSIQVYIQHPDTDALGTASLTVDPLRSLADQIADAARAALTNQNPPWELPGPPAEPFRTVRTVDERLLEDPVAVTDELVRVADGACRRLSGVKVNYAELFVNTSLKLTLTSTGLRLPRMGSDLYFEVAMEKLPLPNTQEVHNYRKSLDAQGLALAEFLNEAAEETLSLDKVELPPTDESAVVLIHAPDINRILHGLLDQCEAAREYNRLPFLSVGERIAVGEAVPDNEPLHIRLDPFVDLMARTTAFTGEGLPAREGFIIEEGVIKAQRISNRMGAYLGREPNGLTGNIVMPAGKTPLDELRRGADRVIEIVSFSSLLVNPDQLTWSSEIKLGRLHERTADGWTVRPVKGGIVSGNIRENLSDCRWSRELGRHNSTADIFSGPEGYIGPAAWLVKSGVTISGAE